ncbi:MAG: cytochrome c [Deltaproteobacteria bacterium]
MSRRALFNLLLLVACIATFAVARFLPPRDMSRPYYEFVPEAQMAQRVAFDSFAPNPNFPDRLTLRTPPAGTIARGQMPLHYEATPVDAVRAGEELNNPFSGEDAARLERGSAVFANFCQVCHGPAGFGNAPVTQRGFPQPASLMGERALAMKDGQMFHVLTYGQGNMPAHAAQLSRADRWSAILHVRLLQRAQVRPAEPGSAPLRLQDVALRFKENCAACHGEDGTGNVIRKVLPLIPDFTSLAWQAAQTDVAIVNQIDYGALPLMPSFRRKLTPRQILELAVYVRTFTHRRTPAPGAPGTPAALPVAANVTAEDVYRTYCFACHDSNGRGNNAVRMAMKELPDFTGSPWQKSRSDADLAHSILEGKGKFMLPMKDKLGSVDVQKMVALVRAFDGGQQVIAVEGPKAPGPEAPVVAAGAAVAPGPARLPDVALPPAATGDEPRLTASADVAARIRVGAGLFRQYCIVCHGPDGTGTILRAQMPPIPDFTNSTWQMQHTDPQLAVSIMDGKGNLMPANRGRITDAQARDLVAYLRSFGPRTLVKKGPVAESDFEKSFRELEQRWNELEKEMVKKQPPKKAN